MYQSRRKLNMDDLLTICREIVVYNQSIRTLAKQYNVSKSCLHDNLHTRIPKYSLTLYFVLKDALNSNYHLKHIRGGLSTKNKWKKIRKI